MLRLERVELAVVHHVLLVIIIRTVLSLVFVGDGEDFFLSGLRFVSGLHVAAVEERLLGLGVRELQRPAAQLVGRVVPRVVQTRICILVVGRLLVKCRRWLLLLSPERVVQVQYHQLLLVHWLLLLRLANDHGLRVAHLSRHASLVEVLGGRLRNTRRVQLRRTVRSTPPRVCLIHYSPKSLSLHLP